MGKATRISELEKEVAFWKHKCESIEEVWEFIDLLCDMPDGAVLYTKNGMRIQTDVANAARMFKSRRLND